MSFRKPTYLLLLFILCFGCSQYSKDDILLQIGEFKLTVYDYEKLKVQYKDKLSNEQIEEKIIEDGYIIAHSLNNRLDTIRILSKKLEYALHLYTSDVGGYVWNKKVAPLLKIRDKDIKDAYEKRIKEYTINVIYFPDRSLVNSFITENSKIQTESEFNSLKIRISNHPNIKFFQNQISYPFFPYGVYTDLISNSKKGDVLGPIETLNGYIVINIAGIVLLNQREYKSDRENIRNILEQHLTEKYIWESQKEIFSNTNPKMNEKAIKLMASKFIVDKKECPGIDNNMILMEYQFFDKTNTYTVSNFMEYINFSPRYYGSLNNINDIKGMLKSYLIGIYLFQEAQEMNADEDDEYKWYKERYHGQLFIDDYKNKIVVPPISEQETKDYYNENLRSFENFETAVIYVYKFGDKQLAMESWAKIGNYYRQKSVSNALSNSAIYEVDGLAPVTMEVQIKDSTQDASLINHISKSNESSLLPTLNINGEHWVVYLSKKSGSEILPYKFAKEDIQRTLFNKKKSETTNNLISNLKLKYPVKLNYLNKYNLKSSAR